MHQNSLKSFIDNRFERWLKRRVPSHACHQLSLQNIFIMPTKFGFSYLFFVFLLFLLATNYQNNIIMLMSYLLASFFITVMMHSFYNFSGLVFKSKANHSGFAKDIINLPITIIAKKKHFDLTLSFINASDNQQKIHLEQVDVGNTEINLPYMANHRGIINSGRIKISSEYSFGLFVSWAMLDFSHCITVYPQPKKITAHQYKMTGQDSLDQAAINQGNNTTGSDDFAELKNYVLGESKARTAWKQFARGQGRYTKHYQNHQGSTQWLKLEDMPGSDLEEQLSFLCYLVLEYSHSEQKVGLDLMLSGHRTAECVSNKIEPNVGYEHQKACLTALANVKSQTNK